MRGKITGLLLAAVFSAASGSARTLMTQKQALASAFPRGSAVVRDAVFLSLPEVEEAQRVSGGELKSQLIVRYRGVLNGETVAYAYFDSHLVRTLPETLMIIVTPERSISRIEILSFSEPMDYFPRARWLEQFRRRRLNEELSLKRAIHPITGASLTGRAIVNASRRILALHAVIERRAGTP